MKIPYCTVRNGNRFFQPTPEMRRKGLRPMPLGPDSEASRAQANRLYEQWTSIRTKPEVIAGSEKFSKEQACIGRSYPAGSIGEAWQKWVASDEWKRLAPSTRNKIWWEAWNKRIEPAFGVWHPDQITWADLSLWRSKIVTANGLDPAHKAMKVWRAFWRVMRAMRYTHLSDPSEKITNTAPQPRTHSFTYGEAMRLAKTAWRRGYRGLACIIVTTWDTGFSPVDARTARARHLAEDRNTGRYFLDRSQDGRTKTGTAVIGTYSRFGDMLVRRYLADMGTAMTSEAFLFRMRSAVPYGESRLGNDFAQIREACLPGDKRQLRDMRRSAVMEIFSGGGDAAAVSQKVGNTIGRSNALFRTYNPVDLDQVRNADQKRLLARRQKNGSRTKSEH